MAKAGEKGEQKTNLYLLAIVAIVAVVGIVVLVLNSGAGKVTGFPEETEMVTVAEEGDLVGQVSRASYRKLAADGCSCCWSARYGNQYCDCTPAGCGGTCSSRC